MNDEFDRFTGYGQPPAKNGDYAFLLHLIKSLKRKGKGAIILPHGVLFRGNSEAGIRKSIIEKGYFKGIIGLPANLFYGTGIPAAILIIDKENADARKGIFMIDASKGFVKDGNKNRLREQDVRKIVDVFTGQIEVPKFSRMVPFSEIEKNEYNLNIPRYIDSQEEEDMQDIAAHLLGGIPERDIEDLKKYWDVCPSLREALFSDFGREGYLMLNISKEEIKDFILGHDEFAAYSKKIKSLIETWAEMHKSELKAIDSNTNPKTLISSMAEDILKLFEDGDLIDKYDIYQHLMAYWIETMKDDVYMIAEDGWTANRELVAEGLVIDKYFKKEKELLDKLEAEMDNAASRKQAFEEEHGGEEGALEDLKNDKGNITKAALKKGIKEIREDAEMSEELQVLEEYMDLIDGEAEAKKKAKAETKKLDKLVEAKYKELSEDEVKDLVVDMKWIEYITGQVSGQTERISHHLTSRIMELSDRYEETLGDLQENVESYTSKVQDHLKRMGFAW